METEVVSSDQIASFSLDPKNGKLYFLDTTLNEIFRVNLKNPKNKVKAYTGLRNPRQLSAYDKLVLFSLYSIDNSHFQ